MRRAGVAHRRRRSFSAQLPEAPAADVTSFVRPADALAALAADPERFDVVVTDLNMPDLNGLEVARAVASLRPGLPVVLTSGNRVLTDDQLAEANVRFRLDKPFTAASLSLVLCRSSPSSTPSRARGFY